jgi:hypothetical protein
MKSKERREKEKRAKRVVGVWARTLERVMGRILLSALKVVSPIVS